jgi:PadR family transcriptional regulator, regulatory protein PadR
MPPAQDIRITTQVAKVLKLLLDDPTTEHYGLEFIREAKLKSGSLYPILARLEHAGWVNSRFEDIDPKTEGRARRRLYRLTGSGEIAARRALTTHLQETAPAGIDLGGLRPGASTA